MMKKWYVLFIAIALTACTDYVNQIEDEREDWRNAQELAALSSNSSSSSAILSSESHEEFSSSSVKSSDSSSSNLSSESLEGSSSSDAKSCSSEKTTSSSSEKNASSSSSAKSNGSSSSSENAALIDVNDPPLVRDTMFSIDESLANGSFVGKIIAFDPDTILAYCTLFYAIIESDVPFILDSNIIKVGDSSRLDYEVDPVFTFHVRVCDRELCDTALVVVNLNDVNEMMSSSSSGKASWAYLNPAISYGEMTDDRDGQVYKTVEIGDQTWMAENLRYGKKVSNGSEIKDDAIVAYFCYDGDTIKCMKYGGLYSWSEMMALPYNCNNINCSDLIDGDGIHQGICPQDWHVPSLTEWDVLFTAVGGQSAAGKALKSSENWINNGDGLNTYGFSALPAGYASADGGQYFSEMSEAAFWTANIYSSYQAFYISFGYSGNGSHLTTYRGKVIGQSVRCIKNGSQMSNPSSSVSSSSSKASWAYLNSSYSYGEMTDDRDGQVYKTVEIGEQTWMAENLNYETARSFCKNCELYGRLYLWSAAMDSAGLWSTNGKGCGYDVTCVTTYPVRGVCPSGWHLPSTGDWNNLIAAVGGQYATVDRLKSTSGWSDGCGNGVDAISFSAIPAGRWDGSVDGVGEYAYFWSSTMTSGSRDAYRMYVGENNVIAQMNYADMGYGYSVRCVKD